MKVEISVPSSLNEITLEQYQRFMQIDPNADKDFLARKMLEIFCGVTDTLKVKKTSVDSIYSTLEKAFRGKYHLITRFKLGDTTFGFIPNIENITFGEYIDLDSLLNWKDMHKALAVMYRPVVRSHEDLYEIEEYETSSKYSEQMKQAPAAVAVGAMVFFWTLSNELLIASQTYLQNPKKGTTQQEANLTKSMDGYRKLIHSLKGTLRNIKKLHDYQLANAFTAYLTAQQGQRSNIRSLIKEEDNKG